MKIQINWDIRRIKLCKSKLYNYPHPSYFVKNGYRQPFVHHKFIHLVRPFFKLGKFKMNIFRYSIFKQSICLHLLKLYEYVAIFIYYSIREYIRLFKRFCKHFWIIVGTSNMNSLFPGLNNPCIVKDQLTINLSWEWQSN